MARIRFDFGSVTLDAELLDTPTAGHRGGVADQQRRRMTWGEEVYFEVPVSFAREADAARGGHAGRDRVLARRPRIAIGFGRTPISEGQRNPAGGPGNIWAEGARGREGARRGQARAPKSR